MTPMQIKTAYSYDWTEANACVSCHFYPGDVVMKFVVDTWKGSDHAQTYHSSNGNTYCASCHAPFQAVWDATPDNNGPVLIDDWESVTCSSCHPPHDLRVEWGTPIGNYDVVAQDWAAVYESNSLCIHCHNGDQFKKYEVDFQGFGMVMAHKGVLCIDCHMPKVPNTNDLQQSRMTRSHDLDVGENLLYSCLTSGCHVNKSEEWAEKQIEKGIHGCNRGKSPGNQADRAC
jgi:nitrate/TMAO reductase-like tetraheme cytochrome c subunit